MSGSIWTHWHGHPDVLIGLFILQSLYLLGVGPLREKYGLADDIDPRKVATFTLGVLVVLVALVSPIHVLSDTYLFSVHMTQHVMLTLIAPPLLIWGTPDWLIRPLLRPNAMFRIARLLVYPIVAFALFNLSFAMWHIPGLYNLTVTIHGVHIFQHLLLIALSVLMWWPLLSLMPELPRLSIPGQMLYLFALSVASILPFAPLVFSREPLYTFYVEAPRLWNISALTDQQVGAIIMKVGGGLLFMTLMIRIFLRWFRQEDLKARGARQKTNDLPLGQNQRV